VEPDHEEIESGVAAGGADGVDELGELMVIENTTTGRGGLEPWRTGYPSMLIDVGKCR